MKIHHRPSHWVAVALVLAALMLALNEAHGQGAGARGQELTVSGTTLGTVPW